jgi:branched-chain amino acid transport system substrate-binding protein
MILASSIFDPFFRYRYPSLYRFSLLIYMNLKDRPPGFSSPPSRSFILIMCMVLSMMVLLHRSALTMGDSDQQKDTAEQEIAASTLFSKATAAVDNGDIDEAKRLLVEIGERYPDSSLAPGAWERAAQLAYGNRFYHEALRYAEHCLSAYESDYFPAECLRIKTYCLLQLDETVTALEFLNTRLESTHDPSKREILVDEITGILENETDQDTIHSLEQVEETDALYPVAAFYIAKSRLQNGYIDDAEKRFRNYIDRFTGNPLTERARAYLSQIGSGRAIVDARKIGLLVPLSGRYAALGTEVHNAVQLAAAQWNADREKSRQFIISTVDTQGDAVHAILGAQHLIHEEGVIALIGPVLSFTAIGVAGVANAHRIPLITPTATDKRLFEIGPYVFQLNCPPELQIPSFLRYLEDNYLFQRYAVLFPLNSYGEKLAKEFALYAMEFGKEIVMESGYAPGKADFKEEMLSLKELDPDAIYVPAVSEDLVKLAPQFAFYGIQAQILGGNGWNSKSLLESSRNYLESVIYTDFYPLNQESSPPYRQFHHYYRQRYQADPGIAGQLAYDAANVMIASIQAGADTREAVKWYMLDSPGMEGVTGSVAFLESGIPRCESYIFTVAGGRVCQLQ